MVHTSIIVFTTSSDHRNFPHVCSLIPGSLAQFSTVVSSPVFGGVPPGDKNPWLCKSRCLSAAVVSSCAFTFLNLEHALVARSS